MSRRTMIHWRVSHSMNVTRYSVRVAPPASPCADQGSGEVGECVVRRGEAGFDSRTLSLELQLGVKYMVTVATTNCGMQTGSESDPIIILLDCKCVAFSEVFIQIFCKLRPSCSCCM